MIYSISFPIHAKFYKKIETPGIIKPIILLGTELLSYEHDINEALHKGLVERAAWDNTGILDEMSPEYIRNRITKTDMTVYENKGWLRGQVAIHVDGELTEEENSQLCTHIQWQIDEAWGSCFSERVIPVNDGKLYIHVEPEPVRYYLKVQKKYEITNEGHPQCPWLHRIRAVTSINDRIGKGSLGGFVESEQNLSQEGTSWIYDDAISCESALVERSAGLYDGAMARGSALITGESQMYDRAVAEGNCCIRAGEIKEEARVAGDSIIGEGMQDQLSPLIAGKSHVYGTVRGWFVIKDLVLPGESLINNTEDLFLLEAGKREVLVKQPKLKPPKAYERRHKKMEQER